jgi:hypothetical protein
MTQQPQSPLVVHLQAPRAALAARWLAMGASHAVIGGAARWRPVFLLQVEGPLFIVPAVKSSRPSA